MKVTVEYPQIMKMTMSSSVYLNESEGLDDLKSKIYTDFWQNFSSCYPRVAKHGSTGDMTLAHRGVEILTDEDFKACLVSSDSLSSPPVLQVVFNHG